MDRTVTASFEHPSAAEDAAAALVRAGFDRGDVLVFPAESDEFVRRSRLASPNVSERAVVAPETGAALGFTLGFLGGGFLGLLLGSGALNIMGREPAMAAGPFWAAVIGALALGAAGALAGFLFNAPLPTLDPAPEAGPVRRLTVVSVSTSSDRAAEALAALQAAQPQSVRAWRRSDGDWSPA